ncbi:uncharacterized protein LOC115220385 [Octopus sinensis]|uniref:Uncharacterized protein LOC115220385 n=1 Tax=Octopus sinensis TaxID=2607531 RepID=A0A6P7T7K2_9MOLL|nr:uncharacterized protein LOC115220385 [Octopus sinensis]
MVSVLTNIFCSINSSPVMDPFQSVMHMDNEENLKFCRKEVHKIVKDMVLNFDKGHFISKPESDICAGMRKSVLEIYNTYRDALHKNVAQLLGEVADEFTIQKAYRCVVDTILEDRKNLHWRRISMVFIMLALLAEDQRAKKHDLSWEHYNQILIKIFRDHKIDIWINDNGGWDGFLEHIHMKHKSKLEEIIWLSTIGLWSLSVSGL